MKTRFLIYVIISFVIISLSGCKEEYKTTTKINSDGSCERIIIAKADSSRIFNGRFFVPHDKSWDLQHKILGNDTQKVFIVHKNFDDVNKINDEYKGKDQVGIGIKFEKKFRWFFTYLTYKETYKSYNKFNRIPVSSYLTKEEYKLFEAGDTSNALKKRIDNYVEENILEEFYQQLVESVGRGKDPVLSGLLSEKRGALLDSLKKGSEKTESIMRTLRNVLGVENIAVHKSDIERIMENINSRLESMSGIDGDYTNEVIMPGIILNTNASTLEGNKATWKFNQDRFSVLDYEMIVESRVSNLWAIYVTGGIVILIIGLLLLPRFRKMK